MMGVVVLRAVEMDMGVLVVDGRCGGSLSGNVESFVVVGAFLQEDGVHDGRKAVGYNVDLVQDRWQAPQGFGQVLVTLDFEVEAGHDFIERQPLLLVVLVLLGHFVEGVGDVEGVVQILRIEDQGQLVAALRHFDQPLVLAVVAQGQAGAHVFHLLVLLVEFRAQDAEGFGEIALVEHGESRNGGQQRHEQDREEFLFHAATKIASYKDTKLPVFCYLAPSILPPCPNLSCSVYCSVCLYWASPVPAGATSRWIRLPCGACRWPS